MATVLESNKTKIAKRVIEVFEFFDGSQGKATVMDIVRRYGRPQSSTSELLSSLVEMGLLYKDSRSRSYSPTPRLATLGTSAQPAIIRSGRLFEFMDRLAAIEPYGVALFGMVGTHAQVFRWAHRGDDRGLELVCGSSELLSSSTAGLLMLSMLGKNQASRMLWRLNAEAPVEAKFNHAELCERVQQCRDDGHAVGEAGFISGARVAALLLPSALDERPLALGAIYRADQTVDIDAIFRTFVAGIADCVAEERGNCFMAEEPLLMRA